MRTVSPGYMSRGEVKARVVREFEIRVVCRARVGVGVCAIPLCELGLGLACVLFPCVS